MYNAVKFRQALRQSSDFSLISLIACPSPESRLNVSSSRPLSRAVPIILAPIREHATAAARPIPEEAPVIRIYFPAREKSGIFLFLYEIKQLLNGVT